MTTIRVLLLCLLLTGTTAFSGGIVTNTNQSAEYIRTMNRNASTSSDAAYFNPAGTAWLEDGLFISLSNQSIFQGREVINDYSGPQGATGLNKGEYTGEVTALFFPAFHMVRKKDKLAAWAGFMPVGGGGSADYANGLPGFEMPVSDLYPMLADYGVTGYNLDMTFNGTSTYLGGQAGIAYRLNEKFSVALGGRYIYARNTYKGHLKNIQVNTPAGSMAPGDYLRLVAQGLTGVDSMTAVGTALVMDEQTADQQVDVQQTGTGITGILGVNIMPVKSLNIGLRYEHLTPLELKNETEIDDTGLYPDGAKTRSDMPALIATGVAWQVSQKLKTEGSFNYYLNTDADWEGREDDVDNGIETGLGFEYSLTEKFKGSAGYLYSFTGAREGYQTDISYSLDSRSLGFGLGYDVSHKLALSLGGFNTRYDDVKKTYDHPFNQNIMVPVTEAYKKKTSGFAVGLEYKI